MNPHYCHLFSNHQIVQYEAFLRHLLSIVLLSYSLDLPWNLFMQRQLFFYLWKCDIGTWRSLRYVTLSPAQEPTEENFLLITNMVVSTIYF